MNKNRHKHRIFSPPRFRRLLSLAMIFGVLIFNGCAVTPAPTHVRDGREYGIIEETFRNRWWNYYQRAVSFAEGEFYQEALTDLREAVRQRTKDQRMARTYGMHFIDYFPHRELGVIHYQMQDMETARAELELSLNHFPSAKARFYLDRVRKALIEKKGGQVSPPVLEINLDSQEIWTREDPVILSGMARDPNYVSGIMLHGKPLFSEGSRKQFPFEARLPLSQGRHVIELAAKNLPGKITKQQVIVHVDREGPVIAVENFQFHPKGIRSQVIISGSVYDDTGVSELLINGHATRDRGRKEIFFDTTLKADTDELHLIAKDRLGNQIDARISLRDQGIGFGTPAQPTAADVHMRPRPMLAAMTSDADMFLLASLFGPKDSDAPAIRLREWTETQTVFLEKIYLEGEIRDETRVVSLSVNQTPVLRREGQYVFFGHMIELEPGENQIVIEARDAAGNIASKRISVIRKVPKALQLGERLSMTILPFDQSGEISELSISFQDSLIHALVNQNRFRVIERDRLETILREQKLSRTELIEKDTALKLGRLIAARSVLTGRIIATRPGVEVVARLIDSETSEILATADVYDEIRNLAALKTLSEGMAVKFHRDFPLLDGQVIRQKGKYILIDLGGDMVKLQRRFIVYREESVQHPVTGNVLGTDNVITGHARISQVMPALSKAEILDNEAIQTLDKVIAE